MNLVAGYRLQGVLHNGIRSTLLRGRRLHDDRPVVLKLPKSDYLDRRRVLELRREYAILRSLPVEGVVQPLGLEELPDRVVLVLEDFGGASMAHLLGKQRKLDLDRFLDYAIKSAEALEQIHRQNIIHKDINPRNILVNVETGAVKLCGLSSASSFAHEPNAVPTPASMSGTLGYMAPEQTGRTNAGIDHRADYYALGATCYEMLVGVQPFMSQDPLELVHAHLAKTPAMPHEVDPGVPEGLSRLVMKLLAKSPDERYQTARGLVADLEACRRQLRESGTIGLLELGRADRQRTFQPPRRLHGRSEQVAALVEAYAHVAAGGRALVLLAGNAGVGKTCLINAIQPQIVASRGRFIAGKCDPLNRSTPFAPFVQAISSLVRQLLAEPVDVQAWARRTLEALGANAAVLAEAVPELRYLIGEQPAPTPLPGTESRNRLHLVLQRFLRLFTGPRHPLVLFLDDLQWADSATVSLLQYLGCDRENTHLLLLGAYRDRELDVTSLHASLVGELDAAGTRVCELHLAPLDREEVAAMVAESVGADVETTRPLGRLIHARTGGNPLFIKEFLRFLHARGLLTFDEAEVRWSWDLQQIEHHGLPDNVVELMANGIRALPPETVDVLRVAACLGAQFDFHALALVREEDARATAAALWAALGWGVVVPLDPDYRLLEPGMGQALPPELRVSFRFVHDRVRQAAYSLLPPEERDAVHARIGLRLFHGMRAEGRLEENLFAILTHLDRAPQRVQGAALRLELAKLHLAAGRQAKASGAWPTACELLRGGIAFLDEGAWESEHALAFALHLELSECLYLAGELEAAVAGFSGLLQRARSKVEQGSVYAMQVALASHGGHFAEALRIGLEGLRTLGVDVPADPDEATLRAELGDLQARLGGRSARDLLDLPPVRDPVAEAAMMLLARLPGPAYQVNRHLYRLAALRLMSLSLEHGNSRFSPEGYVTYGILLASELDAPEAGLHFGQLATELAHRFGNPLLHARSRLLCAGYISLWTRSLRIGLVELTEAYEGLLENGDRLYAGQCLFMRQYQALASGAPLPGLFEENERLLDFLRADRDRDGFNMVLALQRMVLALTDREHAEARYLPGGDNVTAEATIHVREAERYYLLGEYEEALAHAEAAASLASFLTGSVSMLLHAVTHSLTMTALHGAVAAGRWAVFRERLAAHEAWLRGCAARCPENFSQHHLLVSAELARVDGRHPEALELYDRAIEAARRYGLLSVEALANELAFRFHLGLGRRTIAGAYLLEALYSYERWGARAKVNGLARKHAELLPGRTVAIEPQAGLLTDGASGTVADASGLTSNALDLATVVKASQIISSEIVLPSLLRKLVQVAIENVGAQRGLLILRRDDDFYVEVEGGDVSRQQPVPLAESTRLCLAAVNYALRTGEPVLLHDASTQEPFGGDPYIVQHRVRSLLCAPIVHQGRINGLFYLENNRIAGAFTRDRLEVLHLLSSQTSISIDNARLYEQLREYSRTLEDRVAQRTEELNAVNAELHRAIKSLRAMQDRIIVHEKLASLGSLTAGIAHEIKNPLNFVNNFAESIRSSVRELRGVLQERVPIPAEAREDVTTLLDDAEVAAQKVHQHGQRANRIIQGMLQHSRSSSGVRQPTDLNQLVTEALELSRHIVSWQGGVDLRVETDLAAGLRQVNVVPEDISRVMVNLLNNAFYAARQKARRTQPVGIARVRVSTRDLGDRVEIRVRDNGDGVPGEVRSKLFMPFFTTKPSGEGTGLGLSISYEIVTRVHGGDLRLESEEGQYAEFIVTLPRT